MLLKIAVEIVLACTEVHGVEYYTKNVNTAWMEHHFEKVNMCVPSGA